jgi:hypothetical protein
MWHGEAFHRQGVRVSRFWFLLVLYFCQVCLQHLRKIWESWSSCCLVLYPNYHLGSCLHESWK